MKAEQFREVPKKACRLNMPEDKTACFSLSEGDGEGKQTTLSILGYSGGVIPNHWYWGNLVISTEGMSFPKDKYPVLYNHQTDRRIGFSDKPVIQEDGSLLITTSQVLDNADAKAFIADSKSGFPFQASISIEPQKVRRLDEGETMMVNGFEFTGPGSVITECVYMEVSACVFGYDSNTSSSAFADDANTILVKENIEMNYMESWKKEDPEGFAAFCAKQKDDAIAPLKAQIAEKDAQITKLSAEAADATTAKSEVENRLSKLERDLALRAESEARASFSARINEVSADLPEHMRGKFAKQFSIADYRNEDGSIAMDKLNTALSTEHEEWQSAFAGNSPVIGGGSPAPKDNSSFGMSEDEYANLAANCGVNIKG